MCDPELDDIDFNTNNKMPLFNTKFILLIKIKDYPIGKNLKCYVWFEGVKKDEEVINHIKNSLTLSEAYKDYIIADMQIVGTLTTNSMQPKEKFGELNLISINNVYEGNPKKQKKEKKFDFKDIKYSELNLKDLESIDRKVNTEIFKRQNNLNDDEYKFYMENMKEINLADIKDIYQKCGGDIYKLRKDKIRKNIADIFEAKKVVE